MVDIVTMLILGFLAPLYLILTVKVFINIFASFGWFLRCAHRKVCHCFRVFRECALLMNHNQCHSRSLARVRCCRFTKILFQFFLFIPYICMYHFNQNQLQKCLHGFRLTMGDG